MINSALAKVDLALPTASELTSSSSNTPYGLNKPLQRILSQYVRRTQISLKNLVQLVRCQTYDDTRPNKAMVPDILANRCSTYEKLPELLEVAQHGIRVPLRKSLGQQSNVPKNHPSATARSKILLKNIRREQDEWRCLVLDLDILSLWPEVQVSPYGVVDKGNAKPEEDGRVIHDLSFPEGGSVNDHTDKTATIRPEFENCDAIAKEIIRQTREFPHAVVKLLAGDVASAFRNVGVHSDCVFLFAGHIAEEYALIIDLSGTFGWTGSPGAYSLAGGAISHVHGCSGNIWNPSGFFQYHWVDDHVLVAADVGTNCIDMERSLRSAILTVLGPAAINEDKFTGWSSKQKFLGLIYDTVRMTVSIPEAKVDKAVNLVQNAYESSELSRSQYRSLLGYLRHVATCIRPARAFLQRLRCQERFLHRWQSVSISDEMRKDLLWWLHILRAPALNGVPLEYFNSNPSPHIIIEVDSSDTGLCAVVRQQNRVLVYSFSPEERELISKSKTEPAIGFDINFRELLSCGFAIHQ